MPTNSNSNPIPPAPTADPFDRAIGALEGLPDTSRTKPTTIRDVSPLVGATQTFIVQTYRQKEKGDTIFVEVAAAGYHVRLALPPGVADCISRQRDALTARARSRAGRERAEADKRQGIVPGFMRGRRPGRPPATEN
jgi:hypothetical protein